MKHTAGAWDPDHWPLYFIAADPETLLNAAFDEHDNMLLAVNELMREHSLEVTDKLVSGGRKLFLDSGVYWLSTQHAKAHGLTMDQALSLAPEEVDDFDKLFDAYVNMVARYEGKLWGYIEIDQGGKDNKRRTRARLEAMGLRPIPVYHPLNDGWDYFDELAEQYDRICLGNVVMASAPERKRLVSTAWERRRKYPHLWIHALGLTPSELSVAYPLNSCDSSAWFSAVRFGHFQVSAATKVIGDLQDGFLYDRTIGKKDTATGHVKARRLCGYQAAITRLTLLNMASDFEHELGADIGLFDQDGGQGGGAVRGPGLPLLAPGTGPSILSA